MCGKQKNKYKSYYTVYQCKWYLSVHTSVLCFFFVFYAPLVDVLKIPIDEQRSLQGDETSTRTMDFSCFVTRV